MKLSQFFSRLLHRHTRTRLPEVEAANKLLADTRTELDAEALALQVAVGADGAQAGRALAGLEQRITDAYSGLLARTEAVFGPTLSALGAQLAHLLARTSPERLDAVERDCTVQLSRLHAQSRPALAAARRAERGRWRELRAFRFRHRLDGEARYPESRALHYSALAFVCVVEALANTWAFAQGSSLGIVGGLAQALIVAAVNVVIAFFAGRAASGLFHRNWGIKSLAAGLVAGWAVFEGLYALTVAHYRITLVSDVASAPWMALERMKTMPLAIDDVTSVLLTVFTLAFGVAALLTGLATDDSYPGFGARSRAHKRAHDRLEALRKGHLGAIDAIYLPAPARLAAIATEATGITDTYRHGVETLKCTAAALDHSVEEVAAAHRQAVLTAREVFAHVSGQTMPTGAPVQLVRGTVIDATRKAIAEAEGTLTGFPTRLARLESERVAAETRLQQQHAEALEAAPAFFAETDRLAAAESEHDEAEAHSTSGLQRSLWNDMEQVRDETRDQNDIARNGAVAVIGTTAAASRGKGMHGPWTRKPTVHSRAAS